MTKREMFAYRWTVKDVFPKEHENRRWIAQYAYRWTVMGIMLKEKQTRLKIDNSAYVTTVFGTSQTSTADDGYPKYRRRSPDEGGFKATVGNHEIDNRSVRHFITFKSNSHIRRIKLMEPYDKPQTKHVSIMCTTTRAKLERIAS
ncbi:hypothetical protein EVAR_53918_1 [Eumeta japonica]|uniref:Uncharacterized protein n=1 Tax=Eumeta variegata TaxID=151549 RepID=A0A4C1YNB4_EUMVA|nr:hypothetical protein EVAR_53918_1 [Eumeta japonica]